jgi:hypothetical protein
MKFEMAKPRLPVHFKYNIKSTEFTNFIKLYNGKDLGRVVKKEFYKFRM